MKKTCFVIPDIRAVYRTVWEEEKVSPVELGPFSLISSMMSLNFGLLKLTGLEGPRYQVIVGEGKARSALQLISIVSPGSRLTPCGVLLLVLPPTFSSFTLYPSLVMLPLVRDTWAFLRYSTLNELLSVSKSLSSSRHVQAPYD